jgi:ABC-type dipeptide/oligopeptide/nickel transport system permease component
MATFPVIHLFIFAFILLAPIAVIVGLIVALRRNRRL